MAEQPEKCLTPQCDKPKKWKGICTKCYGQARKLIDENATTWEELSDMGMVELDSQLFRQTFKKKKAANSVLTTTVPNV